MIQSAVTISLVPEAKGGPFIFWEDLPGNLAKAARLGFDGVEVFAPSADELDARLFRELLTKHGLKLAAMGTGAGWILRKLRLSDPDPTIRAQAHQFISAIIDFAGGFGAPAIIGSMQGRFEGGITREQALDWVREALEQLGPRAQTRGVPLLFEPINRYETNLINSVADGLELLQSLKTKNIKLLCDLFHMNIEEKSIPEALRIAGKSLGHVHFVDSNRRPAGNGHIDFDSVAQALKEIEYSGYVSAETLAYPNSEEAATMTLMTFKTHFQR